MGVFEYGSDLQSNNQPIQIAITPDNMSATMYLNRPETDGDIYSYEQVKTAIAAAGIKMGVIEENIHNALEKKLYNEVIQIAKGQEVIHGEDGRYEIFFDANADGKPKMKEDGSVDYYNIKLFEMVGEGQKLVQYIEPTKGSFGFDVKGRLLQPKPGKPKVALRGKGFTVSEDGHTYFAAFDGKVEYRNTDLNVINILEISGDVDLNVGNIDFTGDVTIKGNVISGMTVRAKGNVYIGGYIEGATILSEKDVVFAEGANGKGIGVVEAKGNINAQFLENITVKAGGDINVGYILNSNVVSYGKVKVYGKKGVIHGGDVTGVLGIEALSVGNISYTQTIIQIGPTKEIKNSLANVMVKLKEIMDDIDMFNKAIKKLEVIKEARPEMFDQTAYTKLFQSKIIRSSEKVKYENISKYFGNLIRDAEYAKLQVDNDLYPGTRIMINGLTYTPQDQFCHVEVRRVNDKITVRDY